GFEPREQRLEPFARRVVTKGLQLRVRQRDKGRTVRSKGPPQIAELAPHLDQLLDVVVSSLATHRAHIELLEPLLHALERRRVRPQNPFEQRREEARAV